MFKKLFDKFQEQFDSTAAGASGSGGRRRGSTGSFSKKEKTRKSNTTAPNENKIESVSSLPLGLVPPSGGLGGVGKGKSGGGLAGYSDFPIPDPVDLINWDSIHKDWEFGKKDISKEDFIVVNQIGQGTFAKVMLVQKIDTGKLYAMKVIDKMKMLNQGRVRDLFSERSVLKRAKHPFIVKLHYTFQSQHQLFFVMDFMQGGDLLGFLERCPNGRFEEEQAKFYAAEIFLAIQYLHANDIVYRDLKPSNVLLDDKGHTVLADMGLCKELNVDCMNADNRCRSFVGSPAYVAPEIIRRKKYGHAVDWWSFGIVLHRMLTGEVPFRGENVRKIFESIIAQPVDLRPYAWLSSEARNLLLGLLQKDETKRLDGPRVQAHPWFANVDWDQMASKSAAVPLWVFVPSCTVPISMPTRPTPTAAAATAHHNSHNTGQAHPSTLHPNLASPVASIASSQQQMFAGFTYTGDNLSRGPSIVFDERGSDENAGMGRISREGSMGAGSPLYPFAMGSGSAAQPSSSQQQQHVMLMFPMDDTGSVSGSVSGSAAAAQATAMTSTSTNSMGVGVSKSSSVGARLGQLQPPPPATQLTTSANGPSSTGPSTFSSLVAMGLPPRSPFKPHPMTKAGPTFLNSIPTLATDGGSPSPPPTSSVSSAVPVPPPPLPHPQPLPTSFIPPHHSVSQSQLQQPYYPSHHKASHHHTQAVDLPASPVVHRF